MKDHIIFIYLCLLVLAHLAACSAESTSSGSKPNAYTGLTNTSGLNDPSSPNPIVGNNGGTAGSGVNLIMNSSGTTPVSAPSDEECGGDYYDAEPKQLDIYVMLDDSGSMFVVWAFVVEAVKQFMRAPESAGIGMGIKFFGPENPCDPSMYATPAVPIAQLPGNQASIELSLPLFPVESTPTLPAMQGAIQYAQSWAQSHPDSKTVVWLITDGIPSSCGSTVENVAAAAAEGLNGNPSIPTYVVGIGDLFALDAIAQAGGTEKATIIDIINMTASSDALLIAMNELRQAALPCDYALPRPDNGGTADPNQVNLHFKPAGGQEVIIPNVPNAQGCDPIEGGWYYNETKTRLIACDNTCQLFKQSSGEVFVILGCETVILM